MQIHTRVVESLAGPHREAPGPPICSPSLFCKPHINGITGHAAFCDWPLWLGFTHAAGCVGPPCLLDAPRGCFCSSGDGHLGGPRRLWIMILWTLTRALVQLGSLLPGRYLPAERLGHWDPMFSILRNRQAV